MLRLMGFAQPFGQSLFPAGSLEIYPLRLDLGMSPKNVADWCARTYPGIWFKKPSIALFHLISCLTFLE
jgi:hypothetical protein